MVKKRYETKIPIIIMIILFAIVGFFSGAKLSVFQIPIILRLCLVVIFTSISMIFNIIIHEIGHIVLGVISGYEFKELKVLSFTILKDDNGKLKIKKDTKLKGTAYGGQAVLNINSKNFHKNSMIKMFLGGGLFNLIFSIITLILIFIINNPYTNILFALNSVVGIMLFILNLVIYKSKYMLNDGYWIYSLVKDNEAVDLLLLEYLIKEGVEPNKLDDKYLNTNKEKASKYCSVALEYYRYLKAIHNLDMESGKEKIKTIIEFDSEYDITPLTGTMFTYTHDIFFYYAVIEDNIEKAKEYYDNNKSFIENSKAITKARALATYEAKINKDTEKAKVVFKEEFEKIKNNEDKGLITFEEEFTNKMLF